MPTPIEILLADDHEIFRDGFNLMFKKNEEIVLTGDAPNGKELLRLARELKPDVIITDIQMPVMDGITATRLLSRELPHIGIIALSMYNEENEIIEVLEAGAKGYLIKNAHKTEIIAAIKTVHKGLQYYCHQTTQKLASKIGRMNLKTGKFEGKPEFSETEKEIIQLICDEYSNKEIAGRVRLSKRTVEWYRHEICEKLHVKNTAGIVVYAVRNKIYEAKKTLE